MLMQFAITDGKIIKIIILQKQVVSNTVAKFIGGAAGSDDIIS
jgi:hypothetical protein